MYKYSPCTRCVMSEFTCLSCLIDYKNVPKIKQTQKKDFCDAAQLSSSILLHVQRIITKQTEINNFV